ncbi:MAG: hypothetical protein ACRYFV_13740 [Janthinobacterium lividum]
MSAPLIIPDHIKQARLTALGAGISMQVDDPGFATLMFAAIAYNKTPQVNKAELLRQDCERTQHELEKVSSDLVHERGKVARLTSELTDLRRELAETPKPAPTSPKQALLMAQVASLRSEVARRSAHTDVQLLEQVSILQTSRDSHRRAAKKQRKYLRHIQRKATDVTLPIEERLAEVQALVDYGLSVGTEEPDS